MKTWIFSALLVLTSVAANAETKNFRCNSITHGAMIEVMVKDGQAATFFGTTMSAPIFIGGATGVGTEVTQDDNSKSVYFSTSYVPSIGAVGYMFNVTEPGVSSFGIGDKGLESDFRCYSVEELFNQRMLSDLLAK